MIIWATGDMHERGGGLLGCQLDLAIMGDYFPVSREWHVEQEDPYTRAGCLCRDSAQRAPRKGRVHHRVLACKKADMGKVPPVDPIAQTSRWMAAARARESEHPYRLFDDPLAAALAGPEGFAWLERMEPVPRFGGPALYVVVRTRFFDDFLLYACWGAGIRQVVLMAAGMDARAFRLKWPSGTRLYELDRPEVLTAKEEVLARAGARPACERRVVGADLGGRSWSEALSSAGYEARAPSVWLMEGLLFYMSGAAVRRLMGTTGALVMPHSLLGVDLVNRDLLNSPTMRPLLAAFARRGASGRFGSNDPEALLAEHGWVAEATQAGEWSANYGRWPYPVARRGAAGVPRIFFVRAWRNPLP